jgi:hypothetical protein
MVRRKLFARLDSIWSALCIGFLTRLPLPPDRSIRLLNFFSTLTGLRRPCPVVVRR